MLPIIVFLIGFFTALHGASQFNQDIFTAAGYLIIGAAVMLFSLVVAQHSPSRKY
jgi:hypothetical protein